MSEFFQDGPALGNEYNDDFLLQAFLKSRFRPEDLKAIEIDLKSFGDQATTVLIKLAEQAEREVPVHIPFDAWGRRKDEIRVSGAWKKLHEVSAREALVAIGFERKYGGLSRLYQFSKLYLFHASSAFYSCPLAMTDGAARILEAASQKSPRFAEAFKNLTSRDPQKFWTSGQWMTEKTGGSDVSQTSTVARRDGDHYKLYGVKWFSSATTAEMALGLARIEGAPEGSRGLSLFYIPMRRDDGALNGIEVLRLKDKLGTQALPTAELKLEGTEAWLVSAEGEGVKAVSTMLNITRLYNAICSVSQIRRVLALAKSYAAKRQAFGKSLKDHPLHIETLGEQFAIWAQTSVLTWRLVELLGREDLGQNSSAETALLRLFTPIAKLWTAKMAVSVVSEGLEAFGGAGYIEDTGLPVLLRNAQVFPIWEGTTNVLSLDVLRVAERSMEVFEHLGKEVRRLTRDADLIEELEQLELWVKDLQSKDAEIWQTHARRLAFRLAEVYSRALVLDLACSQPSESMNALVEQIAARGLTPLPPLKKSAASVLLR